MPLGAFLRAAVWMFMGVSVVVERRRANSQEQIDRPLFPIRYSLLATRYSLLATRHSLLPVPVARPPFAPRHARGLGLQRLRGRLVLLEIELDLGAVDVEKEHLPGAGLALLAELVAHAALLELGGDVAQAAGAERHMVEHAVRVLGHLDRIDHMQHRLLARIHPGAGASDGGTIADLQAEDIAVEILGRGDILGQDGEMVHRMGRHRCPRGVEDSAISYRTGPGGKARTLRRKGKPAQRRQPPAPSHPAPCGPGKSSELSPAAQ